VESDQHYAKDVIAGAAIGIVSSYIFTRPYLGVTVQPAVDAGYYGVRLSRTW
jgi:membrane-associated phospholipid phosphatase